ncbi:MAG: helix-turn-helix domain-containing protein [Patescibacteria group bacterium]
MDELFNTIGLNKNEREVYLAVFQAGKIPPHRIATLTGINRTTVYSVAKKLERVGLIAEDLGQRVGYLVAVDPEKLATMFEKEEKKIGDKKKAARELAKELSKLSSEKQYSVPRIKFVEEADLSDYLYKQYPTWLASQLLRDNTWWGYQDNSFTKEYGGWIDWCWRQPGGETTLVRFFSNEDPTERAMSERHRGRETRELPKGEEFDSCLWVTGDYVLMAQTRVRPHYLVEINDTVLARNQRQLFKNLWEMSSSNNASNIISA